MINTIHNRSCIPAMKEMEDGSVDLIVTDPPYGVDYGKKSTHLSKIEKAGNRPRDRDKHFKDTDINIPYLLREYFRLLKEDAHCYVFCGTKQLKDYMDWYEKIGFRSYQLLLWVKPNQTFDMSMGFNYCYQSEFIFYFRKGKKKLNKLGLSNVLFDGKASYNQHNALKHPTQKPLNLIRKLIQNSSKENDLVLDPFMGSGTTAVACESLNRRYIGFEIAEAYYNIGMSRLRQQTLQNSPEWGFMGG